MVLPKCLQKMLIIIFFKISIIILTVVHSGNIDRRAFCQNVFRLAPESDQAPPPPVNKHNLVCNYHHLNDHHVIKTGLKYIGNQDDLYGSQIAG